MCLKGKDETESLNNDLGLVVNAAISNVVEEGLPVDLLEDVRGEILARADRTFLWTTLILDLLGGKVEGGVSRRELDEILRSRDIDLIAVCRYQRRA